MNRGRSRIFWGWGWIFKKKKEIWKICDLFFHVDPNLFSTLSQIIIKTLLWPNFLKKQAKITIFGFFKRFEQEIANFGARSPPNLVLICFGLQKMMPKRVPMGGPSSDQGVEFLNWKPNYLNPRLTTGLLEYICWKFDFLLTWNLISN